MPPWTGEQQHSGFFCPESFDARAIQMVAAFVPGYPIYSGSLFDRERLRFINWGHGQREVTDGKLGYLSEPTDHFMRFRKGWFIGCQKHAE